ncbi:hypothetical protein B0H21DRAFT_712437 [Amylocystis lapponica]|nr:hypothetical protein B0H21DRAFT_712437 [Amylocystis lapponica]
MHSLLCPWGYPGDVRTHRENPTETAVRNSHSGIVEDGFWARVSRLILRSCLRSCVEAKTLLCVTMRISGRPGCRPSNDCDVGVQAEGVLWSYDASYPAITCRPDTRCSDQLSMFCVWTRRMAPSVAFEADPSKEQTPSTATNVYVGVGTLRNSTHLAGATTDNNANLHRRRAEHCDCFKPTITGRWRPTVYPEHMKVATGVIWKYDRSGIGEQRVDTTLGTDEPVSYSYASATGGCANWRSTRQTIKAVRLRIIGVAHELTDLKVSSISSWQIEHILSTIEVSGRGRAHHRTIPMNHPPRHVDSGTGPNILSLSQRKRTLAEDEIRFDSPWAPHETYAIDELEHSPTVIFGDSALRKQRIMNCILSQYQCPAGMCPQASSSGLFFSWGIFPPGGDPERALVRLGSASL